MNRIVYIVLLLAIWASCQDHIHLDDMTTEGKIVVYCFPCSDDTLYVNVSRSLPTNVKVATPLTVKDVECWIDGKSATVKYKGRQGGTSQTDVYYVVCKCTPQTAVRLRVSAEGLKDVFSETTIPDYPHFSKMGADTILLKGEWYTRLHFTLANSGQRAYYAVRVIAGNDSDSLYREFVQNINTDGEPLLNNYSGGDIDDFGTSDEYYHHIYIFDNSQIHGDTYVMHLNMPLKNYIRYYRVQLFSITKDYYLFMKAINNVYNNNFSEYGLSFVTPSYTNVQNGFGVVAGYNIYESQWNQ